MALKSTTKKYEWIRDWVESGEEVKGILDEDGPEAIERLMMSGHSLRNIARQTHLSATYLSQIKNSNQRISPTSYLALLRLEMKGK